jgi:hypothetical protein
MEGAEVTMSRMHAGLSARLRRGISPQLILGAALGMLLCGGCRPQADPNREFAMTMNGEEYPSHLGSPLGALEEIEAGFSNQVRCRIVFPLTAPGTHHRPGVEIAVDPQKNHPRTANILRAGGQRQRRGRDLLAGVWPSDE